MTRKSILVALLVGAGVAFAGVGRAELPRHTARPSYLSGVPCYDYRTTPTPTPTVTAMSLTKVTVVPEPVLAPAATVVVGGTVFATDSARVAAQPQQLYQLLEPRLKADHCFLSRVAVAFHADGAFQISFRADQNPQVSDDIRSPLRPGERLETTIQTSQLKRNQFVVRVRGYAAATATASTAMRTQGVTPPVLVELPVEPFLVQKGEPYSGFVTGRSDAVRRYFGTIDRVEVEFTYR